MGKLMKFQMVMFAAVLMAGCDQSINHGEVFAPEDQTTKTQMVLDTQVNRGARLDATLYTCHFDGQYLNSLGMAKLDEMVRDRSDPPVQVWLAVPEDERYMSRRMSVAAYLKDRGLAPEQIQFGRGANPDTDHPASEGLKGLVKMDADTSTTGSGTAPGATPPGGQ